MKSCRKELWFETPGRRAFLNITPEVEAALNESGVQEGFALVNAMHITASVFINDDESGLHADYDAWLDPSAVESRHHRTPLDRFKFEQIRDTVCLHRGASQVQLTCCSARYFSLIRGLDAPTV